MKQAFIALESLQDDDTIANENSEEMKEAEKKISQAFSAIDQAVRIDIEKINLIKLLACWAIIFYGMKNLCLCWLLCDIDFLLCIIWLSMALFNMYMNSSLAMFFTATLPTEER